LETIILEPEEKELFKNGGGPFKIVFIGEVISLASLFAKLFSLGVI
jgi:hypothetical protein